MSLSYQTNVASSGDRASLEADRKVSGGDVGEADMEADCAESSGGVETVLEANRVENGSGHVEKAATQSRRPQVTGKILN